MARDSDRDGAGERESSGRNFVGSIADTAATIAEEFVQSRKAAGAGMVGGVAASVRGIADGLDDQSPSAAHYARGAAEGIERVARDLDEKSLAELADTVVDFARARPALFFAGAVVAGLALSRFVKSVPSSDAGRRAPSRSRSGAYDVDL